MVVQGRCSARSRFAARARSGLNLQQITVRYLMFEHLPRSVANLALTDIRAQHPDATGP